MTENAVLLVTRPNILLERVGGITVFERQLLTIRKAGIKRLWIGASRPDERIMSGLRLPADLELNFSQREAARECPTPYLLISGDHFIRHETLRYIAAAPYRVHVTLEDPAGSAVVQVVPFRTDKIPPQVRQPVPLGASVFIDSPVGRGPEVTWLLATGTKSQDGFMARHFDRYISLSITRLLLDTPVTPNMMTVVSSVLGLIGAAFFLLPSFASRLTGAGLIWLHSVLDGCDGELARLRMQESALGAFIDFWGDNLVHLALFGCMAWGFFVADKNVWPLLAGLVCSVGTLGSAFLVYRQKQNAAGRPAPPDGIQSTLTRVENILAARDFIYVLLILAYFEKLYEFMWMTAVGSMLFLAMMLYLRGEQNDQARESHPPRQGQVGNSASGDGSGHQYLYSGR